jgi:hypothetical protein
LEENHSMTISSKLCSYWANGSILILSSYISKTIRDRGKVETAKMFSMSRSTNNFPQLKMCDNCVKSYSSWNAFFCWLTAFGYSNCKLSK